MCERRADRGSRQAARGFILVVVVVCVGGCFRRAAAGSPHACPGGLHAPSPASLLICGRRAAGLHLHGGGLRRANHGGGVHGKFGNPQGPGRRGGVCGEGGVGSKHREPGEAPRGPHCGPRGCSGSTHTPRGWNAELPPCLHLQRDVGCMFYGTGAVGARINILCMFGNLYLSHS